ncbi:short transient receptor potential channel 2-like [Rhinatrema bivittatum]|uniref:short transient receptor potential channel 2-like n=1 Tax=Rhinatrema bivittatum TaxID=194408 RepID=UPI0011281A9D|nr:short transient receptor potential channel 2-like [Rhinatrema bivittatum]
MAPVKIRHIVSFSSQDPKHPVENLLSDDGVLPWLSCPRDRSRQLRVELQLEQASPIGYVDVGNCGSAVLQIDVGRSSWPLDRPYATLLPATTLMSPANSKLGENRTGVRMFREGDFLSASSCEKWDRVRVICSQPFHKHAQFGLSFLRLRTPSDGKETEVTAGLRPPEKEMSQEESGATPWLSNPAVRRTFFSEIQTNVVEEELKSRLQQLDAGSAPRLGNGVCLSRTARMVISAAQSRRLLFPLGGSASSLTAVEKRRRDQEENKGASLSHSESGSSPKSSEAPPAKRTHRQPNGKRKLRLQGGTERSLSHASSGPRQSTRHRGGRGRRGQNFISQTRRPATAESSSGINEEVGSCPICGGESGCFHLDFLPMHASNCGEVEDPEKLSSSSEDSYSDDIRFFTTEEASRVPCPLCGCRYSATAIEQHASTCGEQAGPARPSGTNAVVAKCHLCGSSESTLYLNSSASICPQGYRDGIVEKIPDLKTLQKIAPPRTGIGGSSSETPSSSQEKVVEKRKRALQANPMPAAPCQASEATTYDGGNGVVVNSNVLGLMEKIDIRMKAEVLHFVACMQHQIQEKLISLMENNIYKLAILLDPWVKGNIAQQSEFFTQKKQMLERLVSQEKHQRHGQNRGQANWREIVNKKLKFPIALISAIHDGNVNQVQQLLQVSDGILRQLDDSEDRSWREALNLAIRTGNEEIMKTLLHCVKFDFRQIHEALLVAVDTNQPHVVKILLDRLDQEKGIKMDIKSFSLAFFDNSIDNSRFAPGVTPLTLACEKDLYEIVEMLMKKGHVITTPHKISCSCLECSNGRKYDLLKFSLSRINTYKGIASRAYLSIASEDAMLRAFKLSRELKRLSRKEPEFKPEYLSLEKLCQAFAVELLGMCRNQSEVTAVLNDAGDDSDEEEVDNQAFEEGIPNLARLRLAVNHNQKRFVAHPICQQVLSSIWCGSLSGWRGSNNVWKLFISCAIFFTMPLLCLIYWIAPKSKVGKVLKIPVIKFLLHSASYLWFLIFLLVESLIMEQKHTFNFGRDQNLLANSFHMIWVAGFFWFECKEVWIEGLRSYFLDWWNFLDIVIISMYLASFTLRLLVTLKGYFSCQDLPSSHECYYFTESNRLEWYKEDPQLIAEVLFAVTSMLSFTRLVYILPAHENLGTLQISIGKMIDDMIRFMFILMIILMAFLCGINNIYVPYTVSEKLGNFNETFQFLFWTMFGMGERTAVDMNEFVMAEFVGRALYGLFTIIMVIVLLNMLVAMITNSFQKIMNDADVEWKFARSKLYLSYFREGLTLPVPFNIIPTPKSIFYFIRGIFRFICCYKPKKKQDYPPISSISDRGFGGPDMTENRSSYRLQVIKALVQRYIDTARREFEESRRKDLGNRITELNKSMGRLHVDVKLLRRSVMENAVPVNPKDDAGVLSRYIMKVRSSFQHYDQESISSGKGSAEVTVHQDSNQDAEANSTEDECPPYPEELAFNTEDETPRLET